MVGLDDFYVLEIHKKNIKECVYIHFDQNSLRYFEAYGLDLSRSPKGRGSEWYSIVLT